MTAVLQVLLLLLKWLGILLLVLLGLILIAIMLVLFAPVRYKGKLEKKEEPEEVFTAEGLVSWLNPFLRIRLRFAQKKFSLSVRLLGFRLFDSEKPKKPKKEKKAKREKQTKKDKKVRKQEKETSSVNEAETKKGFPVEIHLETASDGKRDDTEVRDEAEYREENREKGTEPEKKSIFAKIKAFFAKVGAVPKKIKEKVSRFIKQVQLLWYKREKVVLFLQDELHLLALGKAWTTVKQIVGHCLPGKVKGQVYFGTGDPESTGKALAGLGILYAAYGKGLSVIPDFHEKHLVADLSFKGRIRLGTLLFKVLKLIRDKRVKRFMRNWKKLWKILKQKVE